MLKFGILGVGRSHPSSSKRGTHFIDKINSFPEARVTALCDLDETFLEKAQARYGVDEAYTDMNEFLDSDVDVVVICTAAPLHAAHSIRALEAGKHVLSEVPAVVTLDEGVKLVEAAKRSGKQYMMGENYRFFGFIESWKAMIEKDMLGKLIYAEGEYVHDIRWQFYHEDGSKAWRASFPPIQYCTHPLGPILYLFEDRCVRATGLHTGSNIDPKTGAIDMEVGLFRLARGGVVKILCSFSNVRDPESVYYSLYGTKGCIETNRPTTHDEPEYSQAYFSDIPNAHGMTRIPLTTSHSVRWGEPAPWHGLQGHGTGDYFLVKRFVEALQNDTPVPIDVYRSLDFTAPGICAHQSAKNGGTPVEIPDYR